MALIALGPRAPRGYRRALEPISRATRKLSPSSSIPAPFTLERDWGRVTGRRRMMGEDLLACMLDDVNTDIEKTMIELQRQALLTKRAASFNRRWRTA